MGKKRDRAARAAPPRESRKPIYLIAMAAIAALAVGLYWPSRKGPRIQFTAEAEEALGKEGVRAFREGLETYFQRGSPNHKTILVSAKGTGRRVIRLPDGSKDITLACSFPGNIDLVPEEVRSRSRESLRGTALHEATHACKPVHPLPAPPGVVLSGGEVVTGIHGFAVLVRLPSGENTGFRLIEEGAAEALAKFKDDGYTSSSPEYYYVGAMTIQFKNYRGMTPGEIQGHIERNDLAGYMTRVLGRPAGINARDLDAFMSAYDRVSRAKSKDDAKRIARQLLGIEPTPGATRGNSDQDSLR